MKHWWDGTDRKKTNFLETGLFPYFFVFHKSHTSHRGQPYALQPYIKCGRQFIWKYAWVIQDVPLATKPGISLIILPLMRILQRNLKRTTDTSIFISHTTNVLVSKFRCNIFIGVRIIKEMPGSVASETHCIFKSILLNTTERLFNNS